MPPLANGKHVPWQKQIQIAIASPLSPQPLAINIWNIILKLKTLLIVYTVVLRKLLTRFMYHYPATRIPMVMVSIMQRMRSPMIQTRSVILMGMALEITLTLMMMATALKIATMRSLKILQSGWIPTQMALATTRTPMMITMELRTTKICSPRMIVDLLTPMGMDCPISGRLIMV